MRGESRSSPAPPRYARPRWPRASSPCSRWPGARSGCRTRARSISPSPAGRSSISPQYYMTVADAALLHLRERPTVMKRFVNGIMEEPIWQKRVPKHIPDWLQTRHRLLPVGPHGRGAGGQRRRPSGVGRQPRRDRLQPVAGPARGPRPSGRAARRPRSHTGHHLGRRAPHRDGRARRARASTD